MVLLLSISVVHDPQDLQTQLFAFVLIRPIVPLKLKLLICDHRESQRRLDARRKSATTPVQETECLARRLAGQVELCYTLSGENTPVRLIF